MKRYTELLTLYFPQPCLKDKRPYAEIRNVINHGEQRISGTKGNVNLTDYWFTMVDVFMDQDVAYTCQHIDLLSDSDSGWWKEQMEAGRNWVCFGFIKWITGSVAEQKRNELKMEPEGFRFYHTFGNADCIYAFSADNEENLKKRIDDFKKNNEYFFSSYYLYGQFSMIPEDEKKKIESYSIIEGPSHESIMVEQGWCSGIIDILRELITKEKEEKNKKMVAYYQALGQIVNIIAQYEQTPIYKDLFYMFFPTMFLFLKQLQDAEVELKNISEKDVRKLEEEKTNKLSKMEHAISEFIDSMEILLHHMGHSCRNILSDAGRGGIPYDVPIHLCLMYTAYLHVFTKIMNDRDYEFEYNLVPLAYSRPRTNYYDFDLSPTGRLIKVRISRHMMFIPRSLLIILAHEVSHYVSETPRQRELRSECCVKLANYVMTMMLVPEALLQTASSIEQSDSSIIKEYLVTTRTRVWEYLQKNVWERYNKANSKDNREEKYYFEEFIKVLERTEREVLSDDEKLFSWEISCVDEKTRKSLKGGSKILLENILSIQDGIMEKRLEVWNDKKLQNFLTEMFGNLRECYADICAILVLGISWDEYVEAYLVSESYIPNEQIPKYSLVNRFAMVKYLLQKDGQTGWLDDAEGKDGTHEEKCRFVKNLEENVKEYLDSYENIEEEKEQDSSKHENAEEETDFFCYREAVKIELTYLQECYKQIKEWINDSARQEQINLIRNIYHHFLNNKMGEDSSYEEFFDDYNKLVDFYKHDVEVLYNEAKAE